MYAKMSAFQRLYRFVASCVFAASLLLVPVAAFARGPVEIVAEPCFSGMQPGSVLPITVTLRNSGPSLDGVLEVRASSYAESVRAYDYPVSLPSGAVKSLIVYPATEAYAESVDIVYSAGRSANLYSSSATSSNLS